MPEMIWSRPSRCPLRAQWPLHQALADLNWAAANTNLAWSLPAFSFKADAIVGVTLNCPQFSLAPARVVTAAEMGRP